MDEQSVVVRFVPSNTLVRRFKQAANGWGFGYLLKWISGALYSTKESQEVLIAIFEDALIAFLYWHGIRADYDKVEGKREKRITSLVASDRSILNRALQERLPRVDDETRAMLTGLLVQEFYGQLVAGKKIEIDEGVVSFCNGQLQVEVF